MSKPCRAQRSIVWRFVAILGIACSCTVATAQVPEQPAPARTPPGPFRVPVGPPPTGPVRPLPAPSLPAADPLKPLLASPGADQLPAEARAHPVTLDQAVAIALSANKAVAQAVESLLRAQGRTGEAGAASNPTLSANGTLTQLDSESSANVGGRRLVFAPANQKQASLQGTLPIDISGLLRAARRQAEFQEVAARLDINRARNQAVLDVKTAFFDVLRNQALVRVAQDTVNDALLRLREADAKFRSGTVARFDVIRAQTDLGGAQLQLIQNAGQVSQSLAGLKSAMGVDINTPLEITDAGALEIPPGVTAEELAHITPSAGPTLPTDRLGPTADAVAQAGTITVTDPLLLGPDYTALVEEAIRVRPEVLENDANIAAFRLGIKLARRTQLPTLALSGGVSYLPDAGGFSPKTTSGQAVLSLNLPIFEGGLARARLKEAQADVSAAQTSRRAAVDQVTLEVRQAYLAVGVARQRVAVANQALGQAREGLRLARVRYAAGVSSAGGISPQLELSDAENQLTRAQSSQVSALYDYNDARARLDKAVGRFAYVPRGPGYTAPMKPGTIPVSRRRH